LRFHIFLPVWNTWFLAPFKNILMPKWITK
jgi:hypothetical protein